MKKYIFIALSCMGILSGVNVSQADSSIRISINNDVQQLSTPPILYHDFTMVPLREMLEKLGAKVDWIQETQTIAIKKGDIDIQLVLDSPYALINYQQTTLDVPPIMRNGLTYIPLRFVSESLGLKMNWESKTQTVNIHIAPSNDSSQPIKNLSLEEAVQLALANKDHFRVVEQEIRKSEIAKKEISKDADWKAIALADLSLEMAMQNLGMEQDRIRLRVRKVYQDILLKENELKYVEQSIEISKLEEKVAQAKEHIGQISASAAMAVKKAREEEELKALKVKESIKEGKVQLNLLLGKPKDQDYSLTDNPQTKTSKVNEDAAKRVEGLLSFSPSIWKLEKNLALAERELSLLNDNNGVKAHELAKMDVENAVMALEAGKKQLEELVNALYNNLRQTEDQYKDTELLLEKAKQDAAIAERQYEKGLNSLLEVKKAQLKVIQKENEMEKLRINISQAQERLEKPWIS